MKYTLETVPLRIEVKLGRTGLWIGTIKTYYLSISRLGVANSLHTEGNTADADVPLAELEKIVAQKLGKPIGFKPDPMDIWRVLLAEAEARRTPH